MSIMSETQILYPKPYKLYNKIQHYDWGTRNEHAYIPKLLGIEVKKDVPYAELWIGAHPRASSDILIHGEPVSLHDAISAYPIEMLGAYVAEKFHNALPFLLKILSADKALSIQTHPNKEQAEKLHVADPVNYPDDNHKPEIAIAVDSLTALAGFLPVATILSYLKSYPEIVAFAGMDLHPEGVLDINAAETIKKLYEQIMLQSSDIEKLASVIGSIKTRLLAKDILNSAEKQFLIQNELYGNDIGLLSFFFYNIIELKPGQAIYTGAGIPHAYIKGNIIECMANSDNVVRAGLTPKFKDVKTLLEILHYDFTGFTVLNKEQQQDGIQYHTTAEEFVITGYTKAPGFTASYNSGNKPVIVLVMQGEITISGIAGSDLEIMRPGTTVFIPASLPQYIITCETAAAYYVVEVP